MYVAEYITRSEYECPCCNKFPPDFDEDNPMELYQKLFDSFLAIRKKYGSPIKINSGYRCPAHNKAIDGNDISIHMFGLALDLDLPNVEETYKVAGIVETQLSHLRMGLYVNNASFIHIDIGYLITPRISEHWHQGARWHK